MFNVAICDDEEKQRELVKMMLISLSLKTNIDFQVTLFTSGEQLVSHYKNVGDTFHILIMDVEMSGMNGIQTAKEIRNMKYLDVQIMFLTSYPEYMVESFDVVTFQYLIKPIKPQIFEEKMIKLCQYFKALDKKYVLIKSDYEELLLKYDDILWIEVMKSLTVKNKLKFVTQENSHESKGILSSYAAALKEHGFLQIHRSIMINLLHVQKFVGTRVVMLNGTELPIGRSKVKEVKDAYTKYMIMRIQ
ncbi:LytTR family DNA-binding domain-containing protein [Paenibacillus sp. UMB7766-LJ446]|uniref:LytR/AlgR family response regulator transcription factor n=1 Tax=Paenibacillus sp. UMB7766-LJ446 TaxID=3046313 RepID=UPI00254DA292|nr:LytTR family DNA-binding domain-containing protein [Paenibacillus sp. UMB7766-LJ446]MDK8189631.1 LytTR family DNA-binding domain-containing protein [Paenibacillus sp. UMB7766-LJ446]